MKRVFSVIILSLAIICCKNKPKDPFRFEFTSERAPEWTEAFRHSSGWLGGDGIFAIPLNGVENGDATRTDSILFLFSDTIIGDIKDGKLGKDWVMTNNSVAFSIGNDPTTLTFPIARDAQGKAVSAFVPKYDDANPEDYFWLGDGFVNPSLNNNLYIFGFRMRNTKDSSQFPFRTVGSSLIVVDQSHQPPYRNKREIILPPIVTDSADPGGDLSVWGAAVLVNTKEAGCPEGDDNVYIYGVQGKMKKLVAARVSPEKIEDVNSWSYWNGNEWTNDPASVVALADSVSNEASVLSIGNGRFALVYQSGGIFPEIYLRIGTSPVGPFGPKIEVWNTKKDITNPEYITYNAKAHPSLSRPSEILISYNVNSFTFLDAIEKEPDFYRPRFIRVLMK